MPGRAAIKHALSCQKALVLFLRFGRVEAKPAIGDRPNTKATCMQFGIRKYKVFPLTLDAFMSKIIETA